MEDDSTQSGGDPRREPWTGAGQGDGQVHDGAALLTAWPRHPHLHSWL